MPERWIIRSAVTVLLDGTEVMASEIVGPAPPVGEDLELVRADECERYREALEHIIESCEHSSPTIHAYGYIAHVARRAL
jgi:hypothetical protein